ncbi:MAG: cysteine synthase A [Eubacteriales bacterium]
MKNQKVFTSVTQLIGGTPLLELKNTASLHGLGSRIFAKLEFFNPTGSVKDRIALSMIVQGEKDGLINKDTVIIEPSSGNTGIGLAAVAASRGYKAVIVMPDTMTKERRAILKAYGAVLVLTEGKKGMKGAIEKAGEIAAATPGSFIPGQFVNPANPKAHFETTGPEIFECLGGDIDYFISGVGTGGTLTGAGGFLKSKIKDLKVFAVEPDESPVLSGGAPGPHAIQGLGAGFVPDTLDTKMVDRIIRVKGSDAKEAARELGKTEGILAGISSGAAYFAAISLAKEIGGGKSIVTVFPDTGDRYLSTDAFAPGAD